MITNGLFFSRFIFQKMDNIHCALKFLSREEAEIVWNCKNWEEEYDGWFKNNVLNLMNPPTSETWFQQIADEFNVVFKFVTHKRHNKFNEPCIGEGETAIYKPKDWKPKGPDDDFDEWDINPYIQHDN